jgi:hypothetical protein
VADTTTSPASTSEIVTDLLDALRSLVEIQDEADEMDHDLDDHAPETCALCEARAAIAKAEREG